MNEKDQLRAKLRAKVEANRISRLNRDKQDDILKEYQNKYKNSKGEQRARLKIMIDIITEKQEQADQSMYNQSNQSLE
jgi:hypothetical protein